MYISSFPPPHKEKREEKDKKLSVRAKKVVDVATDEHGKPVFPIKIAGLAVLNLGNVPKDRPEFHTKRYIWPLGK